MAKVVKDVAGALFPTPVVLVTTADQTGKPNIITLAWVGIVCSSPFMVSVAVRPSRHSHSLLEQVPELVVNVPPVGLVEKTDYCGTVSGRVAEKFREAGLTAEVAELVRPPLIEECPVNLECRVADRLSLGTHDLFICEVLRVHIDRRLLDAEGKIDSANLPAFVYLDKDYWTLGAKVGHYGYTKKQGKGEGGWPPSS